jgi:hypothetical protein
MLLLAPRWYGVVLDQDESSAKALRTYFPFPRNYSYLIFLFRFYRYRSLLWFFFVGALAPFPFYYLARRFPLSFWRYINTPVFFAGVAAIPIANPANYAAWGITGFIFNYLVRRYRFGWWMRYNYILSAALDAGVALGLIAIFFILQLPKGGDGFVVSWWGNNVWQNTADGMGTPFYALGPNETFGPSSWS